MSIDTTGLPPGATFGAEGGLTVAPATGGPTIGGPTIGGATMGDVPSMPTQAGPLNVGQSFGPRYHIIKLLGSGGMGAVYQAWDAELSVAVALKVIRVDRHRSASSDAEKRFKQELLLARSVTHKNVVRIHDLGEIDGIKYITMPYVQGEDLSTLLERDGKLPVGEAMRLARQIAFGLQAAHDAGVVHRDLKPANIMVSGKGEERQALIMDFGISASADADTGGSVVGTLEYMAPEQAKGKADARSDIYAYGLIFYEMLTGPRLVAAATPQVRFEAMKRRCAEGLVPLRTIEPSIPETLESFVMKCVAIDAAARFSTASELVAALAALDDRGMPVPITARVTKKLGAAVVALMFVLVTGAFFAAKRLVAPAKPHDPVSVLIADFRNGTGDAALNHTVEPMLRRALEGAGFINAYDRSRIRPTFGVRPPATLDDAAARQLAIAQGLGIVVSGAIDRDGAGYRVSVKAVEAVSGKVITTATDRTSSKDQVLGAATNLIAPVRKALGDKTSESARLFARSMSATSLEVIGLYAAAIEAQSNGKFEDARQNLLKATALDPNFGLGYQGLSVVSRNVGKLQDADRYIAEALKHLDGMTERERLGTRGVYYRMTGDYQQCVKENSDLIARFAADLGGHNQRALCLSKLRNLDGAVDEMRQVVQLVPNRAIYQDNLALYADYAGDFPTAEQTVRAMKDPDAYATLALAFAQTGQSDVDQAAQTYAKLATMGVLGATFAASGTGDLAVYQGRFADAVRILEQGAAADLAAKNPDKAARKFTTLAYAQLQRGRADAARAAAETALEHSKAAAIRFMAARVLVESGAVARARTLAAGLSAELPAEPQAYGRIIEGAAALKSGDARQAVKLLTEANGILDTWLGHFDLGRAYLDLKAFTQADSEFDRCIQRRGEALSVLVDEEPTFGHLPIVYYYQGLVREGLKNEGFANAYLKYLDARGGSTEDPLLPEIHRRAGR